MARRKLNLNTIDGISKSISRIANDLLEGELDKDTANALLFACQVGLTGRKLALCVEKENQKNKSNIEWGFTDKLVI